MKTPERKRRWNSRRIHYWLAIVVAVPLLVKIGTGIPMQVRKVAPWVQPTTQTGSVAYTPRLSPADIMDKAGAIPELGVRDWADIVLLDMRPKKGITKIRSRNRWEAQVDTTTGEVVQVAYRRNEFFAALHEGVFQTTDTTETIVSLRHWIFTPAMVLFALLLITGIWLFFQRLWRRRNTQSKSMGQRMVQAWGNKQVFWRRFHYWASAVVILPTMVVVGSGLLLQVRHEVHWIEPPRMMGNSGTAPTLAFERILDIARNQPTAEIDDWKDVWRVYYYPAQKTVSVRAQNHTEVQLDHQTGAVLHKGKHWSDLLENIHEGKWLGLNYWLFLPSAVILGLMWFTGLYLFLMPYINRRKRAG